MMAGMKSPRPGKSRWESFSRRGSISRARLGTLKKKRRMSAVRPPRGRLM